MEYERPTKRIVDRQVDRRIRCILDDKEDTGWSARMVRGLQVLHRDVRNGAESEDEQKRCSLTGVARIRML